MPEGRRRVTSRSIRTLSHIEGTGCQKTLGEEEIILYSDGLTERYVKLKCRRCKEYARFLV